MKRGLFVAGAALLIDALRAIGQTPIFWLRCVDGSFYSFGAAESECFYAKL
ncbi:MAG: hypothetical protein WBA89_08050 [Microcoleus sp.]